MALSMKDVRKANEEFYSNKYIKRIPKPVWFSISLITMLNFQIFLFLIKISMVKRVYYYKADLEFIGETEVYDWIKQNSAQHFFDIVTILISVCAVVMLVLITCLYWKIGYKLYRFKKRLIAIFLGIMIAEIFGLGIYCVLLSSEIKGILYFFIPFLIIIFLMVSSIIGFFMPLELKVPMEFDGEKIEKILNIIINCIINRLLKKL